MSLINLSRKTKTLYVDKNSGKSPGGKWVSRGPFNSSTPIISQSSNGFSLNGGIRNGSQYYPRKSYGTPFRGIHPKGNGGFNGQYKISIVYNNPPVKSILRGTQNEYIKPSSLNTRGMLRTKYKYLYNKDQGALKNDNICVCDNILKKDTLKEPLYSICSSA